MMLRMIVAKSMHGVAPLAIATWSEKLDQDVEPESQFSIRIHNMTVLD
jgi:hypothetical protein